MSDDLENLFWPTRHERLHDDERQRLRAKLLAYVRAHRPAPVPELRRAAFGLLAMLRRPLPVALAVVVVLTTTGVASAAEQSLPGDPLYIVKINLNERARGVLALSSSSQAAWELERVERRLQEAEALAQRGDLKTAARVELEYQLEVASTAVTGRIAELQARGQSGEAAELSTNLEAAFDVHEHTMVEVNSQAAGEQPATDEGREIEQHLEQTRTKKDEAARERSQAEAKIKRESETGARSAAQGRQRAAQEKIAEVERWLTKNQARVDATTGVEARTRLDRAKKALAEGKTSFNDKAYAAAFDSFLRAHRLAQEAKLLFSKERKDERANENRSESKPDSDGQESDRTKNENSKSESSDAGEEEQKPSEDSDDDQESSRLRVDLSAAAAADTNTRVEVSD